MDETALRADCTRCIGLCCMALAFDRSALFAFDKPAGEPCRHLTGADRCAVHGDLEGAGFRGCADYDCAGAGQHATRLLAPGHWRDGPAHRTAAIAIFAALRRIHDLLVLLQALDTMALSPGQMRQRMAFERQLWPRGGWTLQRLARFERSDLERQVRAFLLSLAGTVKRRPLYHPARP